MHSHLSVVVPVSDTAPAFLARCLDSVLRQEGVTTEILLVDSGKRESFSRMYRALAQGDGRIQYEWLPGRGRGVACNRGLELATGQWVAFVDGDDALDSGYFSRGLAFARRERLDVVSTGCRMLPARRVSFYAHHRDGVMWNVTPLLRGLLGNASMSEWGVEPRLLEPAWGKLYRAEIAKGFRFPEDMPLRTDTCYNLQVFAAARRLGFTTDIDYRRTYKGLSYLPEAESAVGRYLSFYRTFIQGRDPLLALDLPTAEVYGYLEYLRRSVFHRESPALRDDRMQAVRASFRREPWLTAFARVDAAGLPLRYRALRTAYLRRWAEGVRLLHRGRDDLL